MLLRPCRGGGEGRAMVGALEGLRILECGDFVAAPYAATMLGHLGADVIKVEPPEGDSNRRRGPFPPGRESIESGGLHLYLDQAKRGVALDLDSDAGRTGLRRLAATADALIASGPPDLLERRGLTYTALSDANPALVVTTVTPLGLHAATARSQPMRELCDLAVGGWLSISPGALSEPDRPPLKPFGQQAHFQAGIHAAIATLGAIAVRRRTGAGQHVDISVQAVIASNLENGLMHYTYGNRVASRLGQRLLGPWGIIRLADGLLFLICVTDDEWGRMVEFMGHPEWADSPLFADRGARTENNDGLLALIEGELADRPVYETYTAMQARRIPCTPVNDMDGLLRNPHLRERQYWVAGEHPDAGEWTYPGAQWQFERTPWQQGRRAPRLGEHTAEALSGAPVADQSRRGEPRPVATPRVVAPTAPDGPLPLAGVRVIEFTWVWAGPACGLHLAHLGAESIKIESVTRADTVRSLGPFWEDVRGPNRSGYATTSTTRASAA
ncbi:MAG: CoA transferase [Dehalococcoidia bacterium]